MKDITNLFKATVKTLKSRNKAQGINSGPDKTILPSSKKCSDFGVKSKLVVSNFLKHDEIDLDLENIMNANCQLSTINDIFVLKTIREIGVKIN